MAKKTTISSAPTNASSPNEAGNVVHSELAGDANLLPGDAGTNSNDNPQSEAANGGAGNLASPAGLPEALVLAMVEEAGCADARHLVTMAKLGVSVWDYLDEASHRDGPLKDFPVHDDPADMVPYLFETAVALEAKLAFKDAPPEAEGKRGFIALTSINLDNKVTDMLKPIWLTREQHLELAASNAVDVDWDKGVTA